MKNTTKSRFNKDDKCIVFDANAWYKNGGDIGDNSCFMKNATVINIRQSKHLEWLADVKFEDGRISNGHFQDGIKERS